MTEFVTEFKRDIGLMCECINSLAADRRLLACAQHLREVVMRFPDDSRTFLWIMTDYYGAKDLKDAFIALKHRLSMMNLRRLSVLHVQWKLGLFWECHTLSLSNYMSLFDTVFSQAAYLSQRLHRYIQDREQRLSIYLYDPIIKPEELMSALRPMLRHVILVSWARTPRTLSFIPLTLPDLPPVIVPFYLFMMLSRAATMMYFIQDTLKDMWVIAEKDDSFLSLSITSPDMIMRPDVWERLLLRITSQPIGHNFVGFFEPLTWDKGYGQGVIVRLPWANPDGEPING